MSQENVIRRIVIDTVEAVALKKVFFRVMVLTEKEQRVADIEKNGENYKATLKMIYSAASIVKGDLPQIVV